MRKEQNIATKIKKILQRKEYTFERENKNKKYAFERRNNDTVTTTEFSIILYQVYFLFEMEFVN